MVNAHTGPDHHSTAGLWHNLAGLAHAQGHPDRAETLAARAVRIREQRLGPDHHLVAEDLAVLGVTLVDQNRIDDAEPLFERTLTIFRHRHPADQYDVAVNLSNLAACRHAGGRTALPTRPHHQTTHP